MVAAESVHDTPEADASIARTAGTVCVIQVADCLPVLLADRSGPIHCLVREGSVDGEELSSTFIGSWSAAGTGAFASASPQGRRRTVPDHFVA